MLPCSGNNFTVPHAPDPLGNDVFPALGGHLYVYLSSILLIDGGHVDVSAPSPEAVDFDLSLLHDPIELIDAVVSLFKVLVGDGHLSAYGGDEAVGNSVCGGLEVFTLVHAEDHFSC